MSRDNAYYQFYKDAPNAVPCPFAVDFSPKKLFNLVPKENMKVRS